MRRLIAPFMLAAGIAHAGPFLVTNYGHTYVKDWQDLVTRDFTARYPSDTWQMFVYSDAFIMPRSTLAICSAIVGVVPKDSHQFPKRQFTTTRTATVKPAKWNNDIALDFETECVRSAINNMMNTDPAKAYQPYATTTAIQSE